MTEDKCLQVEIKPTTVDQHVQTDDAFDPDLECLMRMDFLDLPDLMRELDAQPCGAATKVADASEHAEAQMCNDDQREYTTLNTAAPKKMFGTSVSRPTSRTENPRAEEFYKELRGTLVMDDRGNMPIHVGVVTNDLKLTKRNVFFLKILNQSIDIGNNCDYTPLQLAIIQNSSIDIIGTLLTNGASFQVTDSEGNNVLHYAVEYERTEALKLLLGYATSKRFNLDEHNHEGLSPLMICCLNGLHDCAEILLDADADPNVRDQISGRTALFHAAEKHDVDMVEMLLQFNACTKIKNFFGTSPHDAMYEIEDMPEPIKFMILGKNKRKTVEDPRPAKYAKKAEISKVGLKTYARMEKIRDTQVLKLFTPVK